MVARGREQSGWELGKVEYGYDFEKWRIEWRMERWWEVSKEGGMEEHAF